ncbi:MAG: tRNA (guanosine(37)-N1)-methyltransferase TrmD [Bdellovibrionales bacterium RIFCSPHIGHO2_01_FULL_40_29]|nr:MAG: tRNA (guanosine(37)-N1)-methyltransferase TrmD [Bdellovibrionales bacterium RIFCSPHIGHO2_01_FULL_40_29]OFZ32993.1 MAG: tRNA (guanosine(37)-N1)-methyltransferase TrmD [Bdellovibrionales bacterium RIFCSPHIGHO2_02_FULL_40_15]
MKKIKFKVLTLFPDLVRSYLQDTILSKAISNELLSVEVIDLRGFSQNRYNSIDDTIFGGGDGMLMQYLPLKLALGSVGSYSKNTPGKKTVYLSPQGSPWTNKKAKDWTALDDIILVCGRYAGIDQRVIHQFVDEEISLGDFVLSGGELAALAVIESVSRFIPGVLGDSISAEQDSFEEGLLEAPQFTKPQSEDDLLVPAVLISGNHQKISQWRQMMAILITLKKRPDLIHKKTDIVWKPVQQFYSELSVQDKKLLDIEDLEIPHDS